MKKLTNSNKIIVFSIFLIILLFVFFIIFIYFYKLNKFEYVQLENVDEHTFRTINKAKNRNLFKINQEIVFIIENEKINLTTRKIYVQNDWIYIVFHSFKNKLNILPKDNVLAKIVIDKISLLNKLFQL
ncbi:MAG1140 family protein [Mycoplasmopsis columbina]|uniref:MAG1140 family protein n=1 Tax=Mycoplasmopsis columbina TaxID=114881 RepID=UPI0004A75E7A|nr:hypothetical protein [Mycoplasmopsis columbina]VEU77162.1 Uncharacterised protein [Mycoplasmopsis columbina]